MCSRNIPFGINKHWHFHPLKILSDVFGTTFGSSKNYQLSLGHFIGSTVKLTVDKRDKISKMIQLNELIGIKKRKKKINFFRQTQTYILISLNLSDFPNTNANSIQLLDCVLFSAYSAHDKHKKRADATIPISWRAYKWQFLHLFLDLNTALQLISIECNFEGFSP